MAVVVASLYILSIGPVGAARNHVNLDISVDELRSFYGPVIWLHDNTFLKQPLEWYADAWDAN